MENLVYTEFAGMHKAARYGIMSERDGGGSEYIFGRNVVIKVKRLQILVFFLLPILPLKQFRYGNVL